MNKVTASLMVFGFLLTISAFVLFFAYKNSDRITDEISVKNRQQEINKIIERVDTALSFDTLGSQTVTEEFILPVILSSPEYSAVGVDVVVAYDPAVLEVVQFNNYDVFDQLIGSDIQNQEGTASFSLVSGPESSGFVGTMPIADIVFKARAPGTSTVSFVYAQNNRNDTNVSVRNLPGEDVLTSVTNTAITVN